MATRRRRRSKQRDRATEYRELLTAPVIGMTILGMELLPEPSEAM